MTTQAIFPSAAFGSGMYESFYLRAVSPSEPLGVWIRNTVHKAPGRSPRGSVWCTVFDARAGRPFMHKLTTDELTVPDGGWIAVGGRDAPRGEGASLGPGKAEGPAGGARWSARVRSRAPRL